MMAKPSSINPLGYIINRQLDGSFVIKKNLFKERLSCAKNLYRKDLLAHYGCVNAIEFSVEGELLISGGDDRRVLLWCMLDAVHGKGAPVAMQTTHISNIFCLSFDSTNSKIFSGGNDDQVIIHDSNTGQFHLKLLHKKPVYGLSVNPQNDFIVSTAGDDGRILIFDTRESSTNNADPFCVAKQKTGFHSVMFHPVNPRLLASANSEEGIALWDTRKPKESLIHYDSYAGDVSGISVCFNGSGSRLLALRRRLPPVLYATDRESAICQFYHPQYYNSCTMKTCCFAGQDDEYVLSGSDDFNLYMWRVPQDDSEWGPSHLVLRGHRSIVNQVRYNRHNSLIASSGVEKMVKLWSTLPVGQWEGSLLKEHTDTPRSVYSHDDYIYLVGHSGQRISHDYSDQSTQEDSRMMAFFDSLIQREIEGWESPIDLSITTESDSDDDAQIQLRSSWQRLIYNRKAVDENNRKQKPNRIAQLIAQNKERLAKMAHYKSPSLVNRNNTKQKRRKRKHSSKSKGHAKSNGNLRKKTSSKSGTAKSTFSDNCVVTTERETRKHKLENHRGGDERWSTRSKRPRTRQNYKKFYDTDSSNSCIDVPSTSTGITGSSNSVFRVIEQDSDEDVTSNHCLESPANSEENFVNILPTPLNGTHDLCLNSLDMTNGTADIHQERQRSTGTARRRKESNEDDFYLDSYVCEDSSDSSECDYDYTPVKKNRVNNPRNLGTPDSGFATGACSSGSGYAVSKNNVPCSSRSYRNGHSSEDGQYPYEQFKKRVKKARMNMRKKVGVDSDSN
ncbi:DDB1- and CUL4-associated factor 5 isoform X2 [Agrilus planipennis]|uniref:DDB1- and CUL4-associated factor 5 isoform X2 n=1 Tax=Agrilus planipennis TaxID=224129 RepID=A0A1W4X6Y0_AGRPL|nr:DDB1- and CUL4-associated factor 5 isoform X2 [Agrilus planipennis]